MAATWSDAPANRTANRGGTMYDSEAIQAAFARGEQVACLYFAACDQAAVGTVPNPVLGDVPCCQRCADRVGATLVPPSASTAGSAS